MTAHLDMSAAAFAARQQHVRLDGIVDIPVDVAYTDLGQGPPLVLLHGIPTWSYLYVNVIDRLSKHYRVIAPDFLGHGYSDHRDLFDRSLEVQARLVLRLLDHLGIERAHLVGHDTGGGVALILAIRHPEVIDRLVLSNIVAYASWPIDDMLALGNPNWAAKSSTELADFLLEGYREGLSNPERLTPTFADGIRAPYLSDTGKVSLIRNAASLNTNHTTQLVPHHGKITAPALVLWGVDDPWQTIADGRRLAGEIPGARLVELTGTSHWLQQDNPGAFTGWVLKFLSEPLSE